LIIVLNLQRSKPEYHKYTMDTLNRFFGIVTLTKLENFQVRYDDTNNIIDIIQRYSKSSFIDAFEPLRLFLIFWLKNSFRRQYRRYVFEPELQIDKRHDCNLYLGMKITNNKDLQYLVYDESRVIPSSTTSCSTSAEIIKNALIIS